MTNPVVKPLSWSHVGSEWYAYTDSGRHVASIHWQSDQGYTWNCTSAFTFGRAVSLDAAKEDVQAYWETFVLSCIS